MSAVVFGTPEGEAALDAAVKARDAWYRRVAVHEAGHFLVCVRLEVPVLELSLNLSNRDGLAGFVAHAGVRGDARHTIGAAGYAAEHLVGLCADPLAALEAERPYPGSDGAGIPASRARRALGRARRLLSAEREALEAVAGILLQRPGGWRSRSNAVAALELLGESGQSRAPIGNVVLSRCAVRYGDSDTLTRATAAADLPGLVAEFYPDSRAHPGKLGRVVADWRGGTDLSANLYRGRGGVLRLHDFVTGQDWDAFDFLTGPVGLSPRDAARRLIGDAGLEEGPRRVSRPAPRPDPWAAVVPGEFPADVLEELWAHHALGLALWPTHNPHDTAEGSRTFHQLAEWIADALRPALAPDLAGVAGGRIVLGPNRITL